MRVESCVFLWIFKALEADPGWCAGKLGCLPFQQGAMQN